MDKNTQKLIERQARWQAGLKKLSWSEKIKMAQQVRESVMKWRKKYGAQSTEHKAD